MKNRKYIFYSLIFSLFILLAGMASCDKKEVAPPAPPPVVDPPAPPAPEPPAPAPEDPPPFFLHLSGTYWKLAGLFDTEADSLRVLEPASCEDCYTLYFRTDSTASGRAAMNRIGAHLSSPSRAKMSVSTFTLDKTGDPHLFCDILLLVQSFEYDTTAFKFFYSDADGKENYLLFKPAEPYIPAEPVPSLPLAGTSWKLAGIFDTEAGSLRMLEPKECKKCYTLHFDTDSTASGYSHVNLIGAYLSPFHALIGVATFVMENGDPALFCDILPLIRSYECDMKELKFFFFDGDGKLKYLLFKIN